MKCKEECKKNIIITDPQLLKVIKSFRNEFSNVKGDETLLHNFYNYVSLKYNIRCERGMIIIERCVFQEVVKGDKLKLYSWIEPVHLGLSLDIKSENFKKAIGLFKGIKEQKSISEMINVYLEVVDCIYLTVGRSCEHSIFFSTLVIVVIHSQDLEIDFILGLINKFKRQRYRQCEVDCSHKKIMEISCGALNLIPCDDSEINFYLTVLKASLEFVEKIEFYDLNITQEDFNRKINN